jgi:hypothetical protein
MFIESCTAKRSRGVWQEGPQKCGAAVGEKGGTGPQSWGQQTYELSAGHTQVFTLQLSSKEDVGTLEALPHCNCQARTVWERRKRS